MVRQVIRLMASSTPTRALLHKTLRKFFASYYVCAVWYQQKFGGKQAYDMTHWFTSVVLQLRPKNGTSAQPYDSVWLGRKPLPTPVCNGDARH